MAWPLTEADCRKCHDDFQTKASEFEAPAFHDIALHNNELGVGCVECHLVHEAGDAGRYFLSAQHTRRQCGRCHSDFID
jgi:nitrate/TMAO reductase-like tetraheme cytochrome c subunit